MITFPVTAGDEFLMSCLAIDDRCHQSHDVFGESAEELLVIGLHYVLLKYYVSTYTIALLILIRLKTKY